MTDKLFYAGIGSRETPSEICWIMHNMALFLYERDWSLRSGGADGADAAFEDGVDVAKQTLSRAPTNTPAKVIYLPWRGYNNNSSQMYPENYPLQKYESDIAERIHPAWNRCSRGAKLLHTRNMRIMFGHPGNYEPVKFVIAWTKDGALTGGTAQALRLAEAYNIPVFNLGLPKSSKEMYALFQEFSEFQQSIKEKTDGILPTR